DECVAQPCSTASTRCTDRAVPDRRRGVDRPWGDKGLLEGAVASVEGEVALLERLPDDDECLFAPAHPLFVRDTEAFELGLAVSHPPTHDRPSTRQVVQCEDVLRDP